MRTYCCAVLMILCGILLLSPELSAGDRNTIGIKAGGAAHAYGAAGLFRGEFEHSFSDLVSIVPSLNLMTYDYEDGDYYEEGSGPGVGCSVRFYPRKDYQQGFWIGPGVTVFNIDWDWDEGYWHGSGSFIGIAPTLEMGGKIKLGDHVYFDPSFAIGYHTSFSEEDGEVEPQATTVFAVRGVGFSFGVGGR